MRDSQQSASGAAERLLSHIVTAPPVSEIRVLSLPGTRDVVMCPERLHVIFHGGACDQTSGPGVQELVHWTLSIVAIHETSILHHYRQVAALSRSFCVLFLQ